MPAPGPSMSTHRHSPASSFRPPRNVTWNGHRYPAMPNRVRIGPIKVNVINYQSVRRGGRVKLRGSHGSLAAACPDRPGRRGRRQWLDVSRLDLAVLFNVANTDGVDILPLVIEDLHVINVR